jgi:hypothetical protein
LFLNSFIFFNSSFDELILQGACFLSGNATSAKLLSVYFIIYTSLEVFVCFAETSESTALAPLAVSDCKMELLNTCPYWARWLSSWVILSLHWPNMPCALSRSAFEYCINF